MVVVRRRRHGQIKVGRGVARQRDRQTAEVARAQRVAAVLVQRALRSEGRRGGEGGRVGGGFAGVGRRGGLASQRDRRVLVAGRIRNRQHPRHSSSRNLEPLLHACPRPIVVVRRRRHGQIKVGRGVARQRDRQTAEVARAQRVAAVLVQRAL